MVTTASTAAAPHMFDLSGGALCLDFANTVSNRGVDAAADDLRSPLAPVIKSTVDLLTSPAIDRVRTCAADTCEWLFLDTTKNRTRRWCDMKVCGNREKVRRFRSRG